MAFHVKTTYFNGYRCSCCKSEWAREKWFQTFEDAVKELPTQYPDYSSLEDSFEHLLKVVIRDGTSGEVVGKGELYWDNTSRSTRYKGRQWFGHVNNEPFEDVK
jgi:hypothetical protein